MLSAEEEGTTGCWRERRAAAGAERSSDRESALASCSFPAAASAAVDGRCFRSESFVEDGGSDGSFSRDGRFETAARSPGERAAPSRFPSPLAIAVAAGGEGRVEGGWLSSQLKYSVKAAKSRKNRCRCTCTPPHLPRLMHQCEWSRIAALPTVRCVRHARSFADVAPSRLVEWYSNHGSKPDQRSPPSGRPRQPRGAEPWRPTYRPC